MYETTGMETRFALSFLPDIVTKELQNNVLGIRHMLTLKTQSHQYRGICLLVEMQGFQAEIDRGLSRDSEGVSIITNVTSTFVGSLVAKVYAWGGDVVEFSGSSIICVFASSSDTDDKITHQKALQCAWQLKDMSQQNVDVHVRMGYGDFSVGFVGGHDNQWRYLFTGRCINELKEDAELSFPSSTSGRISSQGGYVVMSKECHDLFQDERNEHYIPNPTINDIVVSAVAVQQMQKSKREWYWVKRIQIPQSTVKTPPPSSPLSGNEKKSTSLSSMLAKMVEGSSLRIYSLARTLTLPFYPLCLLLL